MDIGLITGCVLYFVRVDYLLRVIFCFVMSVFYFNFFLVFLVKGTRLYIAVIASGFSLYYFLFF